MNHRTTQAMMIAIFFLTAINMRTPITSVTPLLETIRTDLSMNNVYVSMLVAIPVICMGIFAPLAAKIGVRWGLERVVAYCLLLLCVSTAIRAISNSAFLLLFTAFGIGVAVAVAGPLLSGFIKKYFPDNSAIMVGIYTVGMGIGGALGTGVTLPLLNMFQGSWMMSLAAWSLLILISFVLWSPLVRKSQQSVILQTESVHTGRLPWTSKRAWLITLIFGLQSFLHYALMTWLAPMSRSLGMDELHAGAVVTVYMVVQMAFSITFAALSGRTRSRRSWLVTSSVIVLAGLASLMLFHDPLSPWVAAIVLGIGTGGMFSLSLILPLDETASPHEASAWTAMVQAIGFLFGGAGPALTGAIRDYSGNFQFSLIMLIFLCFMMLMTVMTLKPTSRMTAKEVAMHE